MGSFQDERTLFGSPDKREQFDQGKMWWYKLSHSQSFNSSKVGGGGGGLGTSTNINKSNVGLLANDANHYNSGLNESGLQIEEEFGYATDEDSIFAEFFQKDEEKVISRLGRKVGHNSDIGSVKKQVR